MVDEAQHWRSWLTEHGPAAVLLARQWLSNRSDAEDVVQEAFIRFWRARHRASDPTAFLYACVKRSALDYRRSGARRTRREEAAHRPENQPLFESEVQESERKAAITSALAELPEEQRAVVVMKIWGGLSFPQIASALEVSPNTVASRYRYALNKLQQKLAAEPTR
jgi:RNA polymerase sigma-70 factor (ECF subfamily)